MLPIISGSTRDEARLYVALFFDMAGNPVTEDTYPELLASAFGDQAAQVEAEYPIAGYASPSIAWATVVTDRVWATFARWQNPNGEEMALSLDDGEGGIAPVNDVEDHRLALWESLA